MDFSLQLLPEQPPGELIDVVRLADDLGLRGCYSADETASSTSPGSSNSSQTGGA